MGAGESCAARGASNDVRRRSEQGIARLDKHRALAALTTLLVAVGLLTACMSEPEASAPTALQARVDGDVQPVVEPAAVDEAVAAGISELGNTSAFIAGIPMEVTFDSELPDEGATLSRTYAAPLPQEATATFAFWDAEYEVWSAVPTTLSADRRTITAVVHHFSIWNDFVAGASTAVESVRDAATKAGQAVSEWSGQVATNVSQAGATAANALHWSLGNIFSTRVELPECDNPTPNWVITLEAGVEVNDSVRFCVGRDASDPDLLVVKARANRGFGFPVSLAVSPTWEYNSTSENNLGDAIETVGQLDATMGESIAQLLNNGRFVGAGDEISFGIPAASFKDYSSKFFMELSAPSAPQFIASTVAQQVVAWGTSRAEGFLGASIAVANCWSRVSSATDAGQGAGAVLTCLSEADEKIAQVLGQVLLAKGMDPKSAGQLAGKVIGRVSMALALLPAAISVFDYAAEVNLPLNARSLTIDVDKNALSVVPGFPAELQGNWCTRAESPEQMCFDLASKLEDWPELKIEESDTNGSESRSIFWLCLQPDDGGSCSMAGSAFYQYVPAGTGWDCEAESMGMQCDPDYSSLHDSSVPRLVNLYNHQQDEVYHDSPPMYRQ